MKIRLPLLLVLCAAAVTVAILQRESKGQVGTFSPPDQKTRTEAIGDTRYLEGAGAKAFSDSPLFTAKKRPGRSDWLANHPESGQTYPQFLRV